MVSHARKAGPKAWLLRKFSASGSIDHSRLVVYVSSSSQLLREWAKKSGKSNGFSRICSGCWFSYWLEGGGVSLKRLCTPSLLQVSLHFLAQGACHCPGFLSSACRPASCTFLFFFSLMIGSCIGGYFPNPGTQQPRVSLNSSTSSWSVATVGLFVESTSSFRRRSPAASLRLKCLANSSEDFFDHCKL